MFKIITAINNPDFNNKLNEEKNIEIICKDIQYKDAIIEILNKNKNIDIIIINENIPGEINDENLIKKIKEINKKIKIIYILEKQNKNKESILRKNNIKNIYLNNELTENKILEIINNKNNYIKKDYLIEKNNNKNNLKNSNNKIITISGLPNVGKTNFIINFFKIIKNKKILIIDFDLNKQNIFDFLGIKKYSKKIIKINKNNFLISGSNLISDFLNKNKKENVQKFFQEFFIKEKNNYDLILIDVSSENEKIINKIIYENSDLNIFLMEGNLIGINKIKKYLEKNNYIKNINIVINKKDKYCIDKNILNKIFKNNILGEIKYKNFYSNLINRNYNYFFNFKNNYKKEYLKIYKKII